MDQAYAKGRTMITGRLLPVVILSIFLALVVFGLVWYLVFSAKVYDFLLIFLNAATILMVFSLLGFLELLRQKSNLSRTIDAIIAVNQTCQQEMVNLLDSRIATAPEIPFVEEDFFEAAKQAGSSICSRMGRVFQEAASSPVECTLLLAYHEELVADERESYPVEDVTLEVWASTTRDIAGSKFDIAAIEEPLAGRFAIPACPLRNVVFGGHDGCWVSREDRPSLALWSNDCETYLRAVKYRSRTEGQLQILLGIFVIEFASKNRTSSASIRSLCEQMAAGFTAQLYNFVSVVHALYETPIVESTDE